MYAETTLACGNCVYYAMWHKFPPTASWVLIFPCWFILLSVIQTWTGVKLLAIPHISIAIALVLAVFFFSPGMIGPPLGFWIPICCVIGTWVGIQKHKNTIVAKTLTVLMIVAVFSLVASAALDYRQYNQMPAAEKEKLLPIWEVIEKRKQEAV